MRRYALLLGCAMALLAVVTSCQAATPSQTSGQTVTSTSTTAATTGGGQTTPSGQTTAAPTVALVKNSIGKMVEPPQYGGEAVARLATYAVFDPTWQVNADFVNPCYDTLFAEDWTKGPSGTGEIPLDSTYTPWKYEVGVLAESWDVKDPRTAIYHIRQGVHFQNKPPANGREMTADDVVASFNIDKISPRSPLYYPPGTPASQQVQMTKIDKYTVQISLVSDSIAPPAYPQAFFTVFPPEAYANGGNLLDWHNECGTGPYMVSDAVTDSSATFVRNPDYWRTDPFFPDNHLPYISKLIFLDIPDNSTALAALRTHKIDKAGLTWDQGEDMMKTNPELKYRRLLSTTTPVIQFREELANTPWANQKVRQALQMATDYNAILTDYLHGNGEKLTWPYMPNCIGVYTPLDQLPSDIQALYTYNPDGAKKLLSDAGYPNGIGNANITMFSDPTYTDLMAIVKEEWAKVGVNLNFQIVDYGTLTTMMINHTFQDMSIVYWGNIGPLSAPGWGYTTTMAAGLYNYSHVNDKYIDDTFQKAYTALDYDTQFSILKDLGPYLLRRVDYIPLPTPYGYTFWSPWFKGYSGEYLDGRYYNVYACFTFGWIDQSLKQKITGTK
jgi:peptide/nickel transport system substrate-binding protein